MPKNLSKDSESAFFRKFQTGKEISQLNIIYRQVGQLIAHTALWPIFAGSENATQDISNSNSPNNNNNKSSFICMHRPNATCNFSHGKQQRKKIDYYMGHVKCLRFFLLTPIVVHIFACKYFCAVQFFFSNFASLFSLYSMEFIVKEIPSVRPNVAHIGVNETQIMITTATAVAV